MKDREVDTHLRRYLPGDSPREEFKQQALCDSTAEFIRFRRRRSAWWRAELAAAAILIAGVAFLGGRLLVPRTLPGSVDVAQQAVAESDSVTVPSELVAWLDAAHLFRQLGMEDRMARAIDRAAGLMPYGTVTANSITWQTFAAGDSSTKDQIKQVSPAGILRPHVSVENVNGIMAQLFGGYNHANEKD